MADKIETGHQKHQKDVLPPLKYQPTESEFDAMRNQMSALVQQQKSLFHDGLIPGINQVIAGMKKNGDMKSVTTPNGQLMFEKTGPNSGNVALVRPDFSSDEAKVVNGKVREEHLANQLGETRRKYGADGKLVSEDHVRGGQLSFDAGQSTGKSESKPEGKSKSKPEGKPEGEATNAVKEKPTYADHIEYNKKGQPVKTHIEAGNVTIDDDLQKDGSWQKKTTLKDNIGLNTEIITTHKDGSVALDSHRSNGDYVKLSVDALGVTTSLNAQVTNPETGAVVHKYMDKNGEIKEEPLFKI